MYLSRRQKWRKERTEFVFFNNIFQNSNSDTKVATDVTIKTNCSESLVDDYDTDSDTTGYPSQTPTPTQEYFSACTKTSATTMLPSSSSSSIDIPIKPPKQGMCEDSHIIQPVLISKKRVTFNNLVRVSLVPSRVDLFPFFDLLYYSAEELLHFKAEAEFEQDVLKIRRSAPRLSL